MSSEFSTTCKIGERFQSPSRPVAQSPRSTTVKERNLDSILDLIDNCERTQPGHCKSYHISTSRVRSHGDPAADDWSHRGVGCYR